MCKPVFVAYSVLSAIWLLRETLGHYAVPDSVWRSLVDAAHRLAVDLGAGATNSNSD
jgi:hypothetical protein